MKKLLITPFLIALAIVVNSCSSSDDSASGNYAYKVRLTDAPGPYSAVNVDIQSVEVITNDGTTVILNTEAGVYNLLNYADGAETVIASSALVNADVKQVRLVLGTNNSVVLNGVTYPLSTPSAEQSGLKITVNQTLDVNTQNSVLIDFDANTSVVQTGAGTFKLKPVLRNIVASVTGTIEGNISPIGTLAVVTAVNTSDETFSSSVSVNGDFKILGLTPGTYTVTVTPLLPLSATTVTNITVNAGATTDIGTTAF